MQLRPVVIKVGGSLYGMPDLASRLTRFVKQVELQPVLLVPGGGPFADVVRSLDRCHGLTEEPSHWLALQAMSLAAAFLAQLIPGRVINHPAEADDAWAGGLIPIMDAWHFARQDDTNADALPHSWTITSDSIAARMAVQCQARQLILLKSIAIPPGTSWADAGRQGQVDAYFARAVMSLDGSCKVQALDFRAGNEASSQG